MLTGLFTYINVCAHTPQLKTAGCSLQMMAVRLYCVFFYLTLRSLQCKHRAKFSGSFGWQKQCSGRTQARFPIAQSFNVP